MMRKFFFLLTTFWLFMTRISGQDWVVPDNRKSRLSPFSFSDDTRNSGEKIYASNCLSCHGSPGKGNVINLVPPPPDPATELVQKNLDGEIFYKVSEGRKQMPSFKNILTSNEIWNVVSFIRSFNKNYKQEIMPVITSSAYPGAEIKISMNYIPGDTAILLYATAEKPGNIVPVSGADIRLFVFRTFGLLQVGDEQTTDATGIARFRLPDQLPGDTAGNIKLSARFTDEDAFGPFSRDTIISAGLKTFPNPLTAQRAMWNKARMSPLWIMVTFLGGLLLVWSFIFLIMLKIRDVYIIGEKLERESKD